MMELPYLTAEIYTTKQPIEITDFNKKLFTDIELISTSNIKFKANIQLSDKILTKDHIKHLIEIFHIEPYNIFLFKVEDDGIFWYTLDEDLQQYAQPITKFSVFFPNSLISKITEYKTYQIRYLIMDEIYEESLKNNQCFIINKTEKDIIICGNINIKYLNVMLDKLLYKYLFDTIKNEISLIHFTYSLEGYYFNEISIKNILRNKR